MNVGVWIAVGAALVGAGGALYCVVFLRSARSTIEELQGRLEEMDAKHGAHLVGIEHELRQLRVGMAAPIVEAEKKGSEWAAPAVEHLEHYIQQGAAWVGSQVRDSAWQGISASFDRFFSRRA
jgi:hypothetical protein